MQLVSIQHAASSALQGYLLTQLRDAQGLADMTVSDRWPDQKKLPSRTATVLLAGEMEKLQCDKVIALKTAIPGNATQQTYTIQQFQCRQPLQVDLWATAHVILDDLVARFDDLLNQGTSRLPGTFNNDPFGEGVTLLLGSKETGGSQQRQWQGTVMFLFDSFVGSDSPDARQRQEYRATARGFADFVYTSDRVVDRLLTPTLRLLVHEVGAVGNAPATQPVDIYKIANVPKGFVWSSSAQAPNAVSVSPSTGPLAGGSFLTISGASFAPGATVTVGGISALGITVVSPTIITCSAPPGAVAGPATIVVTNPDGQPSRLVNAFSYQGTTGATPTVVTVTSVNSPYTTQPTDDLIEIDESNGLLATVQFEPNPGTGTRHTVIWLKWTTTAPPPVVSGNGKLLSPYASGTVTSGALVASTTITAQYDGQTWEYDGTQWMRTPA